MKDKIIGVLQSISPLNHDSQGSSVRLCSPPKQLAEYFFYLQRPEEKGGTTKFGCTSTYPCECTVTDRQTTASPMCIHFLSWEENSMKYGNQWHIDSHTCCVILGSFNQLDSSCNTFLLSSECAILLGSSICTNRAAEHLQLRSKLDPGSLHSGHVVQLLLKPTASSNFLNKFKAASVLEVPKACNSQNSFGTQKCP